MAAKIGTLAINIVSNHAKAISGMQQTSQGVKRLQADVAQSVSSLKTFAAGWLSVSFAMSQVRKAFALAGELPEFKARIDALNKTFEEMYQRIAVGLLPVFELMAKGIKAIVDIANPANSIIGHMAVSVGAGVIAFIGFISVVPKIVGAIRSIIAGLKALAGAQTIAQALSGPKGWIALAAGFAVAAAATAAVSLAFDNLELKAAEAGDSAEKAAKQVASMGDPATTAKIEQQATAVERLANGIKELKDYAPGEEIQEVEHAGGGSTRIQRKRSEGGGPEAVKDKALAAFLQKQEATAREQLKMQAEQAKSQEVANGFLEEMMKDKDNGQTITIKEASLI